MKKEISKHILGKMLSKQATEAIIEEIAVKFLTWYEDELRLWSKYHVAEDVYDKLGVDSLDYDGWYKYFIDNIYKPE